MNCRLYLLLLALWLIPAPLFGDTYTAEPSHSSVGFSVRNVLVRVTGGFKALSATLEIDPNDPARNQVSAEIDVASLDTGEPKRDLHLQQPEFFDAARHPKIIFRSTAWKKISASEFEVAGTLAIRGITKPAVLKVRAVETAAGRMQWEATTKINRHDYGVSAWKSVIGAEVAITIKLTTLRKSG
jgi:polyisoprenoid-binding protein YceI